VIDYEEHKKKEYDVPSSREACQGIKGPKLKEEHIRIDSRGRDPAQSSLQSKVALANLQKRKGNFLT